MLNHSYTYHRTKNNAGYKPDTFVWIELSKLALDIPSVLLLRLKSVLVNLAPIKIALLNLTSCKVALVKSHPDKYVPVKSTSVKVALLNLAFTASSFDKLHFVRTALVKSASSNITDKNLKTRTFLKIQIVYKLLDIIRKYNSIFHFHKQSKKCMS